MMHVEPAFLHVLLWVGALLAVATVAGEILRRRVISAGGQETVRNLNARIRSWWVMIALFSAALVFGRVVTVGFFAMLSFLALREYFSLTPTRRGDHIALFASFFVVIPLQYWLVAIGWYGLFAVLVPVYVFVALPAIAAMAGEVEDFTARSARVQFGLLLTVYALSNAPALLMLKPAGGYSLPPAMLLLFLMVVVQVSDVFQYVAGKLFGRTKLAPAVSPSKTVEGLVGGGLVAVAVGVLLHGLTPFSVPVAAGMSLLIVVAGFLGGLALSAMKRDLGAKDWGRMIGGHGGILDRMDSVCFAAPVFFHVTRYFYT
jgi:phosphatidate cytidylyltransferase